jgi:hypothetical protein
MVDSGSLCVCNVSCFSGIQPRPMLKVHYNSLLLLLFLFSLCHCDDASSTIEYPDSFLIKFCLHIVAAAKMAMELEQRFPSSQIMDVLSIVYPQFWLADMSERALQLYLGVIKKFFGHTKEVETSLGKWEKSPELLSPGALDKQLEYFRIAMIHNSLHAMRAINLHIHPITKLWRNLSLSPMLPGVFPEYFRLAELAMIMVSFLDFSTISFLDLSAA